MKRPGISLDEWYPIVARLVPTPRTAIVKTEAQLGLLLDGITPRHFALFLRELGKAQRGAGIEYPLFLRTGMGSGKHGWRDTCYVPDAEALPSHIAALVEWSAMADLIGLPFDVWVIRELLPTQPAFTAFRGAMPITRERRWFFEDGRIVGHHPYWPADVFEGQSAPSGWRALLARVNACTPDEHSDLSLLTERVAAALPGAWSVDWLYTTDRGWVLIDMAWAERSFVWRDHPHAGEAAKWAGDDSPTVDDVLAEMVRDGELGVVP